MSNGLAGRLGAALPEGAPLSALRGFLCRCPACGEGRLLGRFLKPAPACTACGQAYHHHRADDFPPYIVMFGVGHLLGYGIYVSETRLDDVPLWLHVVLWPVLAVGLSLALLQPVKGAVIGLQYGLGMHGFDPAARPGRGATSDGAGARRTAEDVLRGRPPRPDVAEP